MASSPEYLALAMDLGLRGYPSGEHLYCRCPLHKDRSASFSLNVANGLWFCHAEQRGGTFSMLVAEVLELSISEAEYWIHERSASARPIPTEPRAPEPKTPLDEQYASATDAELPAYWFERGFDWIDAERWGVRYDRTARRIVLPVRFPIGGPIVGLVSRTVVNDLPKYRNSVDFPRRTTLYGYDPQTRAEAILLTEGPLDVINAAKHGYPAVASFGAFVSREQAALLARLDTNRIIVAADNAALDKAGGTASHDLAISLSRYYIDAKVFEYRDGRKDVGECSAQDLAYGIENATQTIHRLGNLT